MSNKMDPLKAYHCNLEVKLKKIYFGLTGIKKMITGVYCIIIKGNTITLLYEDNTEESAKDKTLAQNARDYYLKSKHPGYPNGGEFDEFKLVSFVQSKRVTV